MPPRTWPSSEHVTAWARGAHLTGRAAGHTISQRPIRRVVPPIGGLDLSVLVAVLLLQIALYVIRMLVPGPY